MNTVRPRYILAGGCLLAFCIAIVNAGFLASVGTSVCHLTGDISRLALGLTFVDKIHLREALPVGIAAAGFIAGAMISGALVHHPQVELARPYGRMMLLIGLLLVLSQVILPSNNMVAIATGSLACGIQNSLATRYRGIVLRTTHLTGLATDLGVALGMKLRGYPVQKESIRIPLLLSLSFLAGAFTGFSLIERTDGPVIAIMGIIYMTAGAVRWIHRIRMRNPASA